MWKIFSRKFQKYARVLDCFKLATCLTVSVVEFEWYSSKTTFSFNLLKTPTLFTFHRCRGGRDSDVRQKCIKTTSSICIVSSLHNGNDAKNLGAKISNLFTNEGEKLKFPKPSATDTERSILTNGPAACRHFLVRWKNRDCLFDDLT